MASYRITSVSLSQILINLGEPFGYCPFIRVTILDSWTENFVAGDSITYSNQVVEEILSYGTTHPCVLSVGGSDSQFNLSDFAQYTYPIDNSATSTSPSYVEMTKSALSATAIELTLHPTRNAADGDITCISNRGNGRLRGCWILTDPEDNLYSGTTAGVDLKYVDTNTNSYLSAACNNGLPYGITEGVVKFDEYEREHLVARVIELSLLDYTEPSPPSVDPYAPGGYSGVGGGGGTFDLESDVIGLPPLPTLSFAATGFTRIYNPTLSELNSLANYLWTDQTFLNTVINHLKQLLENPMDAVISLSLLPCPIPNGSPESVKVMYINTGVTMAPATTQFVDVDCGTYTIEEFYGSALDYNPYTKVHCYLPYIGQVTLDTDEVMGRTLNVVYRIDIVTGMCAAMILVDQNVLYQFSGHCAINMPINSADFSGYIGAAMTAGKMVAGVVAGAAGAPALAAELIGAPAPHSSTSETSEKTTQRNPNTGRQVTSGTSTRTTTRNTPGASFGEMARKAAANTVGAVMGSKLTVEHAGGFTGNSGYLAVRRPYLIIERPRMCNPEEYGRYNGRPTMIYMSLGDCVGYTEVQSIQFENIPATNPELSELSELLKSGVLF